MKRNSTHSMLSVLLCVVLIAALALFAAGCTDTGIPGGPTDPTFPLTSAPTTGGEQASDLPLTVLGEGATVFTFTVVDLDGNETFYEIHTDETIVGSALMAESLIDGEEGPYGLYVKTVCGTTLDYETHGKYWAFYVDGESSLTGVDQTPITAGAVYSFKAE